MDRIDIGRSATVTSKEELRLRLRATRDQVPASWRHLLARAAANRALPYFEGRNTVAVYHGMASELDPTLLVESLRAWGTTIVYPRVLKSTRVLEFCIVDSIEQLQPAPFGLMEPSSKTDAVDLATIDAFVVPALSFDRKGNRLGWGKGHYDHTLAQNSHALRVGLCFQDQIEPSLPIDSNDQSMDWVVTDAKAFQGRDREALQGPSLTLPKEPS